MIGNSYRARLYCSTETAKKKPEFAKMVDELYFVGFEKVILGYENTGRKYMTSYIQAQLSTLCSHEKETSILRAHHLFMTTVEKYFKVMPEKDGNFIPYKDDSCVEINKEDVPKDLLEDCLRMYKNLVEDFKECDLTKIYSLREATVPVENLCADKGNWINNWGADWERIRTYTDIKKIVRDYRTELIFCKNNEREYFAGLKIVVNEFCTFVNTQKMKNEYLEEKRFRILENSYKDVVRRHYRVGGEKYEHTFSGSWTERERKQIYGGDSR